MVSGEGSRQRPLAGCQDRERLRAELGCGQGEHVTGDTLSETTKLSAYVHTLLGSREDH